MVGGLANAAGVLDFGVVDAVEGVHVGPTLLAARGSQRKRHLILLALEGVVDCLGNGSPPLQLF